MIRFAALTVLMSGLSLAYAQAPSSPAGAIPASALAMVPAPKLDDTLRIQSNVGSFKMVPLGTRFASGKLDFTFAGTVLITNLKPGSYLKISGNVRKEYENAAHHKQVFFGKGRIVMVGTWENCQWFGRDLDLTFKGVGFLRMIAEFDKNLSTGTFWFNDSKDKQPLPNTLLPIEIPRVIRGGAVKAITRDEYNKEKAKVKSENKDKGKG